MLRFYNTLSRTKEEFKPINPKFVTMYSCGPTVYNYAHIGNLRTYIFMDLVRRALRLSGYKIKGVMNITDVGHLMADSDDGEDKMAVASRQQNKTPWEIAEYYSKIFFEDLAKLNIGKPEIIAKATDHIEDMINYVLDLEAHGFSYETSDGIYFDIAKFPNYGCLSRANLDDQLAGARVEVNDEKRHPADFALWKKADPLHIMQWQSPWGMGYPGWHIECSAMSQKYLGKTFDIHSGGVDHIPIHHENEIAQNEAITGEKSVNYWLHGEFMLVDNGKMSKSLGNTYTIAQLEEKGYSPLDFRFFCLNTHYRKKLNFTFDGLDAAKISRERLMQSLAQHKASSAKTDEAKLEKYKADFHAAIEDDINVPLALGILFTAIKEPKSKDIYELALYFDKALGLSLDKLPAVKEETIVIPDEVADLIEKRKTAKANKDYALADQIRGQITALGYNVMDTKDGVKVTLIK
ncbi:MAG: cysteine--tRNA ligase [Clostridia bacterium]|nr:cysteine--tRNA ligase [Clostridia bacterium]